MKRAISLILVFFILLLNGKETLAGGNVPVRTGSGIQTGSGVVLPESGTGGPDREVTEPARTWTDAVPPEAESELSDSGLSESGLVNLSAAPQAADAPKESELYAKSAVLMDGDSGRILYEKNGHEALANASTTKILTCILALENCDLDSQVTVSANAASQPKVHLGMREGQTFTLRDLLYGLMLESYNDCAVAIAEYISGDTKGFAGLMNRKAAEIGCTDSYFITPNGLDAEDASGVHHTTAADLARIMRYCIRTSPKAAEFLAITGTQQYSFSDAEGKSYYNCANHNAFLQMMDGAISGKTGFTGTAGYCYVGALERDGKTYIVALLACGWPNNRSYKWSDTRKLMEYGLKNFRVRDLEELVPDQKKLAPIPVEDGQADRIGGEARVVPELSEYEGYRQLLLREEEQVVIRYELKKKLTAPVAEGEEIGRITYLLGDEVIRECRICAKNGVERIDFPWCFAQVLDLLWLV